jgi:hypothetical protein
MTTASAQQDASPAEGVENGKYNYQGSVELGYRFVNSNGSDVVYDTFVNQHQGPRILEQMLNMRSLDHQGLLFDNLFLNSFGWGGDPENATRMRISKNKIYNFNLAFRRDRNFWDYNLLANPLNAPNPFISVPNSPHQMATVRRMYDYNLVLFLSPGCDFGWDTLATTWKDPPSAPFIRGRTPFFSRTRAPSWTVIMPASTSGFCRAPISATTSFFSTIVETAPGMIKT